MGASGFILVAVIAALVGTVVIGLLFSRRRRPAGVDDFVAARNSAGPLTSVATVTASILGGWILFSPAESATLAGITAVVGYGVAQALPLFAYAALGPRIRNLAPYGHSLSEFALFRYGRAMHLLVLSFILLYLIVFLGAEMGEIARAVGLVTNIPFLPTILVVAIATLLYTAYGGLRASIFTDKLQFLLFVPLIIVVFATTLFALGGWDAAFEPVRINNPELLRFDYSPGVELGITFIIGVFAANMFHQGFWQRVYAAKNNNTVRWSFFIGGLISIVLIVAGGFFGLWAVSRGLVNDDAPAAIALFTLAIEVLPLWALGLLVVIALLLVMSSLDTLLNGIVSVLAADIPRLSSRFTNRNLLVWVRLMTVAATVPAILIGFFFDSVLYPFLVADLVCAAGVVPVFLGMFSSKFGSKAAFTSTLSGLVAGVAFFPAPNFMGWWNFEALTNTWHILASGNLLASFLIAFGISTFASLVFWIVATVKGDDDYDFRRLSSEITSLDVAGQ